MKPRIFIGSSTEGLSTATALKRQLADCGECQLWNEDFFEMNRSAFESLSQSSVLFDFAILVATKDDLQTKRNQVQNVARDNIIFEFGLYLGRLGKNRALLLKEKGTDLPSDLHGITLLEFDATSTTESMEKASEALKKYMRARSQEYSLSFIPSTAIAVGYFENFVVKVCRELTEASKRLVDGVNYKRFLLHVILPDELPDNVHDQVLAYLSAQNLRQMKVETNTRAYSFYLKYSDTDGVLELYDFPTTLSAIKKSVELAIPKMYVGENEQERILKRKEMDNFCRTLKHLVANNPATKNVVTIHAVDVE
jgi:hypothetical protein